MKIPPRQAAHGRPGHPHVAHALNEQPHFRPHGVWFGMVRPQRGVGSVVGASRAKPFHVDSSADESLAQALAPIESLIGPRGER
jgi:hypothetical protein